MKLKMGDRVIGCGDTYRVGEIGTVYEINGDTIDVAWDNFNGGHSGHANDGSHNHWRVNIINLKKLDCQTPTKYKVGEWVNVRSYLTTDETYGGVRPSEQMLHKVGQKVRIKAVTKTGRYKIEGSCFTWTDEMFEEAKKETKVEPTKSRKPKIGDRIRMTENYDFAKIGMTGVIKTKKGGRFGVEFDKKFFGGHDCNGYTGNDRGQWVQTTKFEIIDAPKYSIATVTFDNDKEYCYICNISVKKGDKVVVPCGSCDRETIATVVKTGKYTEENAPYPVDKMKKVIRKGTDTKPTSENDFDWDKFKDTKIIVQCRTKRSFENFMMECEKRNIKWAYGDKATYSTTMFDFHKTETSIVFNMYGLGGLSYADVEWHKENVNGATVYDWTSKRYVDKPVEEKKVEDKPTYKVGDMVEIRNDLVVGEQYGCVTWLPVMDTKLSGKIFKIKDVYRGCYQLDDGTSLGFIVSPEMIKRKVTKTTTKKVKTKPTPKIEATLKIEVGDVVRAIDDYYGITKLKNEWEGVVISITEDGFTTLETHQYHNRKASYTRFHGLDPEHFEIIKRNT